MNESVCKTCNKSFPETREYFYKIGIYLRRVCKRCQNSKQAVYNKGEKRKAYRKQYYENNRESAIESATTWQADNKEKRRTQRKKWADNNRETCLGSKRRWSKDNKTKSKQYKANRRALETQAGNIDSNDIKLIYLVQSGLCFYCEKSVENNYHIDHLTPLSRDGENTIENIVVSCPHCNLSKGNKTLDEFIEYLSRTS